ncbi:Hypp6138 [Branchiostoma lanceolatum]|uniref:Hypp6138 protein n=1 Tax=Branchiostoma lanceolatum TaxID=7740 RepID=A0A8J9W5X8_BRALA|nr:Hypp6138 [Branchiostoma lanceolatum]
MGWEDILRKGAAVVIVPLIARGVDLLSRYQEKTTPARTRHKNSQTTSRSPGRAGRLAKAAIFFEPEDKALHKPDDDLLEFSTSLLYHLMLYIELRQSIRYKNGPAIISHWLATFPGTGRSQYSTEAANLIASVVADWPEAVSVLATNNRTVNTHDREGHGKPIGLKRAPGGVFYIYSDDIKAVVRDTYPGGDKDGFINSNKRPEKHVDVEDLFEDKS